MIGEHHGAAWAARLLLSLWLTATSPILAQSASVRLQAMQPFALWVGKWEGSGWSIDAAGKRTEFKLSETVTPKVGGTVLLLEGHGTAADDSARITHDGAVFLYYDERASVYRWNGHDIGSGALDAEPRLKDRGLEWTLPAGGGATIRFTILFDATRWHEVGEVSMDGASWDTFMDVQLLRANR
jgi:hypothetical protein